MTMNEAPTADGGPGFLAFLAFFILALALWFLMRNMNARMRRMSYRQQAAHRGKDDPQVAPGELGTEPDGPDARWPGWGAGRRWPGGRNDGRPRRWDGIGPGRRSGRGGRGALPTKRTAPGYRREGSRVAVNAGPLMGP